jgi:hypothetical protein
VRSARLSILFLLPIALTVLAQTPRSDQTAPTSITGKLLRTTDNRGANLRLCILHRTNPIRRSATTDDDGRFQLSICRKLPIVFLPELGLCNRRGARENQFHLPGESVSLTLRKGGVITGKALTPEVNPPSRLV